MTIVGILLGISLTVGLIVYFGAQEIIAAFGSAGWGILGVAIFHLATLLLPASGWRALFKERQPLRLFIFARLIREGINNLLPIAQIGGEIAGARLLTLSNISATSAAASIVVDLTIETVAQIVFTAGGIMLLAWIGIGGDQIGHLAIGLGAGTLLIAGFLVAQRYGLFHYLEKLLERIAEKQTWSGLGTLSGLHTTIAEFYRGPRRVTIGACWHLGAWILGAGEIWIAFHAMGVSISVIEAIAYETLVQAVRSAAFFVPMGLGVQEGGYVAAATLFGISPEMALAVALIKRARDVLLGAPAILSWQVIEGRKLAHRLKMRTDN